jgi:two-component system, sensor histidine kinase and response regulator
MLKKRWNLILLINFLFIVGFVVFFAQYYKGVKTKEYTLDAYELLSSTIINKIHTLIEEKKNATLTIALSQAKNPIIKDTIIKNANHINTNMHPFLSKLSLQLRKETDFKNVWFQILDKNGVSIARSWVDKKGENIANIRHDIQHMVRDPAIRATISVGLFDMSFKAMVPIFSNKGELIGIFEAITHFNSISTKISEEKFSAVVLLNKQFTQQIKYPFTNFFVNNHYVANKNADKKYLQMIEENSVKYYFNDSRKYTVDRKNNTIIVNYTLFNFEDIPMANILLFKSLDQLDTYKVSNMQTMVNLFMLLTILIITIVFLFLYNKEKKVNTTEDEKIKYVVLFALLSIVVSLIYYQFINYNYNKNIQRYIQEHNKNIEENYEILYDKFKSVSSTMYRLIINTPEVLEIVHNAYTNPNSKDQSREELYALLKNKYEYLKELELKQLHFHLPNNESFLRFHKPQKYGDDLTNIRATVDWVNKNNQTIDGFEEGRLYNGFRFVFPLTYQEKNPEKKLHIGSVETSFSASSLLKLLIKDDSTKASFIIDTNLVKEKVFQEEQANYTPSIFEDFSMEKKTLERLNSAGKSVDYKNLSNENILLANKKIYEGKTFTLISNDKNNLYTFVPIKNPISKKVVASIILKFQTNQITKQFETLLFQFSIGIIAIISILLFIYKEFATKKELQRLSYKTRKILDTQASIIIISDLNKITDVNQRFLTFFGIDSKELFLKEKSCICDQFIKNKNYFHSPNGNLTWVESIRKYDKKDRIVLMKDKNGYKYSFSVSISEFAYDSYIITFNDITHTIQEQLQLKEKVIRDKLTGAYNREFFHNNINTLTLACKSKGKELALIMFDIDYFKSINDRYGHNQGDIVLTKMSDILQSSMRADDFYIRWGGEEFITLCCVNSLEEAAKIAEGLRVKIEQIKFEDLPMITASFGVTIIDTTQNILSSIEKADNALYRAKKEGRNKVIIA